MTSPLLAFALALAPVSDPELEDLAALCGTELEWAADWEEAAARAREQDRLVFVRAMLYPSFAIADPDAVSTFMDPFLVELVNERFVPLSIGLGDTVPFAAPELYGMGPSTFGRGFLIVTPEGEVLRDGVAFPFALLLSALEDERAPAGARVRASASPLERSRAWIRQGRLAQAREALEELEQAEAAYLLARIHRRLQDAAAMRSALEEARSLDPEPDLSWSIELEAAIVDLRTGKGDAARDALELLVDEDPDHARANEARFLLGATLFGLEGPGATRRVWKGLIDRDPDSRWAWQAAGLMNTPGFDLVGTGPLGWKDEEVRISAAWHPFAPLPASESRSARDDARTWLLEHQRADGSWASPTEIARSSPDEPSDFVLAATSICTQSLMDVVAAGGEVPDDAIERGLELVWSSYARDRITPRPLAYLDYRVWSRAYVLRLCAAAVRHGRAEPEDLEETVEGVLGELRELQLDDGGWSYYITNDLSAGVSATAAYSISFTTACVVLALQDADEAGLGVPFEMIDGGLDALEAARLSDKSFAYFAYPPGTVAPTPSGSAGRGPACTLALMRGGRAQLDELRAALDLFVRHRAALGRERGKSLMHCGAEAEGSHYLMFDYATAARALTFLEDEEQPPYRTAVLEELLQARNAEGAYLDNPLIGWASCTGLALDALARIVD